MALETDDEFFNRADAHIRLSNEQLAEAGNRGKVSASMLFASARYNAWVTACGFASGEEMAKGREEMLKYFCDEYRSMLEQNFDDYIQNFQNYMPQKK